MIRAASLFVVIGLTLAKHEIYDGHALYEISVQDREQMELVNDITTTLDLDVWSHALPGRSGEVLVPREKKAHLENALSKGGIEFKIECENIKDLMDLEDRLLAKASQKKNISRLESLPFDQIYTYEEVDAFLEQLAETYPGVVTLVDAGRSFEGRAIKYIRISTTNFQDTNKPVVYMQTLLHAREWITLPVSLYAIDKLVINVMEQDLVRDIDWIILLIANPDGYVHSHVTNRFWRKNRNDGYNSTCTGVDLNRNFDINWGTGSSDIVCSEFFHGSGPFSEPEAVVIRDILKEYSNRIKLSLDIHSFGSMILYGWGNGTLHSNALFLHLVGVRMAHAIDAVKMSWNIDYIVGNTAHVLYETSGTVGDYPLILDIPYSFTYELPRHRFGLGLTGFLVDPDFIEQAGFETWEGIKVGVRHVRDNFRK